MMAYPTAADMMFGDVAKRENNFMVLLRTPPPLPRESLMPYALRLAIANGYPTPAYFLTQVVTGQFSPIAQITMEITAKVARLSDEYVRQLRYADPAEDTTYARLVGQRLSPYDLSARTPRVCPYCTEENGHLEALWDLAWVSCCPIHECLLVSQCPTCDLGLRWTRAGLNQCQNGHSLMEGERMLASEHEINLARLFAMKLYGADDSFVGAWDVAKDSRAADLTLHEICKIAANITNRIVRSKSSVPYIRSRLEMTKFNVAMNALGDLFFGPEQALEALLEQLCADDSTGHINRSFNRAFKWIIEVFDLERTTQVSIVSTLMTFAKKHWPASRINRYLSAEQVDTAECEWMTATEAAKELGLSVQFVVDGINTGRVPQIPSPHDVKFYLRVPCEWVQEQSKVIIEPMSMSSLKSLCGVSRTLVTQLRRRNVFEVSIVAKKTLIKHDVERFIQRLLESTDKLREEKLLDEMDFVHLMNSKGKVAGKAALIIAILDGTLCPTGKIASIGINGLLFDEHAARKVMYGAIEDDCPLQHAGVILGCYQAKWLMACGILKHTRTKSHANKKCVRKFVSMASVVGFQRDYEGPARLLKAHSISMTRLLKIARLAGIELLPVAYKVRNAKRSLWFIPRQRLADLERAIPLFKDVMPAKKYRAAELAKLNVAHRQYALATTQVGSDSY